MSDFSLFLMRLPFVLAGTLVVAALLIYLGATPTDLQSAMLLSP